VHPPREPEGAPKQSSEACMVSHTAAQHVTSFAMFVCHLASLQTFGRKGPQPLQMTDSGDCTVHLRRLFCPRALRNTLGQVTGDT